MSRPDGFYWVRLGDGRVEVAELADGLYWNRTGEIDPLPTGMPGEPTVISGRLTQPGERMSIEELAEMLVFLARKHGYALGYELQDLEAGKRSAPAR